MNRTTALEQLADVQDYIMQQICVGGVEYFIDALAIVPPYG